MKRVEEITGMPDNRIKRLVKNYFLWASRRDLSFGPTIVVTGFLIVWFLVWSFGWEDEKYKLIFIIAGLLASVAAGLSHDLLVVWIRNKFMTYPDTEKNIWFQMALFGDGDIMILKKPVWGKGIRFAVLRPNDLGDDRLQVAAKISGMVDNQLIQVPVILELHFSRSFDEMELFKFLFMQSPVALSGKDPHSLSLDQELRQTFCYLQEENAEEITALLRAYWLGEMPAALVVDKLLAVLEFPPRIFSNITKTSVRIDLSISRNFIDRQAKEAVTTELVLNNPAD